MYARSRGRSGECRRPSWALAGMRGGPADNPLGTAGLDAGRPTLQRSSPAPPSPYGAPSISYPRGGLLLAGAGGLCEPLRGSGEVLRQRSAPGPSPLLTLPVRLGLGLFGDSWPLPGRPAPGRRRAQQPAGVPPPLWVTTLGRCGGATSGKPWSTTSDGQIPGEPTASKSRRSGADVASVEGAVDSLARPPLRLAQSATSLKSQRVGRAEDVGNWASAAPGPAGLRGDTLMAGRRPLGSPGVFTSRWLPTSDRASAPSEGSTGQWLGTAGTRDSAPTRRDLGRIVRTEQRGNWLQMTSAPLRTAEGACGPAGRPGPDRGVRAGVARLRPPHRAGVPGPVRRLPDPDPGSPDRSAEQTWWPPVMLPSRVDPVADPDVFHLQFGFDAWEPEALARSWRPFGRRASVGLHRARPAEPPPRGPDAARPPARRAGPAASTPW